MTSSWHSFPKVWNIGHPKTNKLFEGEVLIEEKVDGSQFSFGIFNGDIKIRSRGKEMYINNPEKMFSLAVKSVVKLKDKLTEGWTYRAEYLSKPKHNTLCYERVPAHNLILFDVETNLSSFLSRKEKEAEAKRLGLEIVPVLYEGKVTKHTFIKELLKKESILGSCNIEGVVVKNYHQFLDDGKVLMGKYVSESFKEKHSRDWKKRNPSKKDLLQLIGEQYRTEARWYKAVQHLKEAGKLENSPKDIGILLKEIQLDLDKECLDEIKEALLKQALPVIKRKVVAGFPEWYKNHLLQGAFSNDQA